MANRGLIKPLCVLFALIGIVLAGRFLMQDDPFFTWAYYSIMIIAADQIRTTLDINGYKQTITMSPIAAIWATLYLQPLPALYACASAYFVSAVLFENKKFGAAKRIVNATSMTLSSAAMILVYNLLIGIFDQQWPSVAAAAGAFTAAFVYDAINVVTLALPMHYAEHLSWRDIYSGWIGYLYYPLLIAVVSVGLGVLVTVFQWGVPLIAIATIMILKPEYKLPVFYKRANL